MIDQRNQILAELLRSLYQKDPQMLSALLNQKHPMGMLSQQPQYAGLLSDLFGPPIRQPIQPGTETSTTGTRG